MLSFVLGVEDMIKKNIGKVLFCRICFFIEVKEWNNK